MKRAIDAAACAAPFLVILALLGTYLLSPQFYLDYVLELTLRESQAVEVATVTFLVLALVPMGWASWQLWFRRPAPSAAGGFRGWLHRNGAFGFVTSMTLATAFFLGEEINWGQTFLHWGTPEPQKQMEFQTNLHNNLGGLSVQALGSLCLSVAIFGLPLAWQFRRPLHLPQSLEPAVPQLPVVMCLAVAMSWKWFKSVYRSMHGDLTGDSFYWGFVEQINEQKELLVALALMLYGLYRIRALRQSSPAPAHQLPRNVPEYADA
jgi:hypothetical protein